MKQKRILYIDVLKLFTIYLVLWGHSIMHFQPDYKQSVIFQTIYAFHMPLFMMLSGYFAISSMSLAAKEFFVKKVRQLLLPCLSWGIICWIFISSGLIYGTFNLEWETLFSGWLGVVDNFWFLKSCFICYVLTWLCWRCGRYKLIAMGVIWILCTMQGRFNLAMMFPSFLLGLYLRKDTRIEHWLSKYWYLPATIFFVILAYKLVVHIDYPYIFRLLLGESGAVCSLVLFKRIIRKMPPTTLLEKTAEAGGQTLGVYILQAIFLEFLMPNYISFESLSLWGIEILMPILSLLALLSCLLVIGILRKSDIMAFLFLGREIRHSAK